MRVNSERFLITPYRRGTEGGGGGAREWEGSGDMKQIIKEVNERMRAEEDGIPRWRHQSVGSSLNRRGDLMRKTPTT